jgi:hypothetical protein
MKQAFFNRLLHLFNTHPELGDSKLFEQTQDKLPNYLSFIGDRAYVGRRDTSTPHKKPPKGELTQGQKEFNRNLSQKRVFVEHVIRVIKIFRVAKEEFRMHSRMYETAIGVSVV